MCPLLVWVQVEPTRASVYKRIRPRRPRYGAYTYQRHCISPLTLGYVRARRAVATPMSLSKQELKIVLKAAVVTLKREFNKRSVVVKEELPAEQ